jgi:chemosensory pili system protein ChpA (sensor histidine kinase/response regulator)
MDVVHTNIRQMKGTLDLHSETGKGMTILIKLPMTLVTVHVLLIRIGSRRFGIPTNHLDQALAPGLGEFQRIGSDLTLKLGKNIYALKSLAALLNVPSDKAEIDEHEKRPIILAREETGVVALVVDELLDGRDLVMKNMGRYVKQVRGVAGASILGDGTVIPLLDLPELLRSPLQAMMGSHVAMPSDAVNPLQQPTSTPHIMIVDDSLSVRKSLSLLIEEAGFETLLAKDGLEAIEVMNQKRPDVMLVDMEMPRMNGLELTAHVRANQTTQNMPIFMITSRTTEKHREQAKSAGVSAYLNKPYQDVELLSLIDKALAGHLPARMV